MYALFSLITWRRMRLQIDRKLMHRWELQERHGIEATIHNPRSMEPKPWKVLRKHGVKYYKRVVNKSERRLARMNPECVQTYKRYLGWEF
jgi:hypothetical protein